ncbi:polyamine (spermidine/putrescine) ABC transporter permease [Mycoplasmopsis maculosa]|uniref:Polyamine (Spermidine/putrescine) ABC transporter permease n=1 Tax=Mycoplasmopsis maculosa TaxID=114885 RepID=A0A449B4F2_9BACT|nr:ABC transporter permease [Mycoplasmopsis maculosa]VEU75445.1 polyamine (spermidine/putrescine) ABC transporter permease [Mycoplasmopsis maculosa]
MNSKTRFKHNLNKRSLLVLPYLLIAILLVFIPIILIIINAFVHTGDNGIDPTILVRDTKTWDKIGRSLLIGVLSAIISLFIAFPYSYFIARTKNKVVQIYALSLILSPMVIFTIAKIYAIKGFFLTIAPTENDLNAIWFMVLGLTYLNLPYMIMPLYSVIKDMPNNILEASSDLGYNHTKTFFKVILPYCSKAILSGLGLIFLSSATTFVISEKLLPDGSQLQTIGELINKYTNPANKAEIAIGTTLVLVVSAVFIGSYAIINFVPKLIIKLKRGGNYE